MIDSELALAALLGELGPSSGYGITSIVRQRGMQRWAGLSPTSIYQGLRRLEARGLVSSAPDLAKRGRGPVGRLAALTPAGAELVRRELTAALADAPEQSTRYRIALAFVPQVGERIAIAQLAARADALRARARQVRLARAAGDGVAGDGAVGGATDGATDGAAESAAESLGARLVFDYVLAALEHEIAVTERLTGILQEARSS